MLVNVSKLLLAMANKEFTDKTLCEKSGVSQPAFARIKTGRHTPRPITVGKLAKALGVSVEYLTEEA